MGPPSDATPFPAKIRLLTGFATHLATKHDDGTLSFTALPKGRGRKLVMEPLATLEPPRLERPFQEIRHRSRWSAGVGDDSALVLAVRVEGSLGKPHR